MLNVGVLVNTLAVVLGSLLGIPIGSKLSERYKNILFLSIGAITTFLGLKMGLGADNFLIVLISLAIGGLLGEWWKIEENITSLADRFSKTGEKDFASGFVFATVLFTIGPMTILGCISSGLTGNNQLLYVKSTMDGISSIILASAYGKGVLASAIGVYLIEGSLVAFSSYLHFLTLPVYINDFTSVGGAILLMIAIKLFDLREIKAGNFLPALVVVPILDFVKTLF
jgi:uncharacterized membrane protein YqgA involved in biofilm formation